MDHRPSVLGRTGIVLTIVILVLVVCACQASRGAGSSAMAGVPTPGAASSGGAIANPGSAGASGGFGTAGGPGASGAVGGPPSDPAAALEGAFEQVVSSVGPAVVVIETSSGLGSGIVFDATGDIVTNAHVVGSDTTFQVTTSAGKRLEARLVGVFVPDDLAVIKVSDGSLPAARFGDSSRAVVGEIVLAVGNPLGLQSSVTEGIVSAVGRTVSEPGGAALTGVIQTSAAINPGNSGGALVDLRDEVIGIPTLAATDPQLGGSAPGIGFAIPSNTAVDIANQLIRNGRVTSSHRAYLGIHAANIQGGQGVLVFSEEAGGPAAKAGIPTNVLITAINGTAITDTSALAAELATLQPGQVVDVSIVRPDGSMATVKVTLGELPG